jgi:hypothetical protein
MDVQGETHLPPAFISRVAADSLALSQAKMLCSDLIP